MDSLGKRTFDAVLAANNAETAIRACSEHSLVQLLDHTESGGWAAQIVHGIATIEAARRFRLDHAEPNFP
jgi:hypothetical protein